MNETGGAEHPWRMGAEDAEEFTRALGQIMSGGWRQIALAQRIGVPEAIGMTTEAWVRERIGGYVRLGIEERREAVKELTDPDGEFQLSQRQAAEVLGVSHPTVLRDLRSGTSEPREEGLPERGEDADGTDVPPKEFAEPELAAERLVGAAEPIEDLDGERYVTWPLDAAPITEDEVIDASGGDEGGRVRSARLRAAYSAGVKATLELIALNPDAVADVLAPHQVPVARSFTRDMRDWCDRIDSALDRGIRLVSREEARRG